MVAKEGLFSLYDIAVFCETRDIVGDFVECGVWKGGYVGLMAFVNLKYGTTRRHIHLFDSFQEICEPDENVDGEKALSEAKRWSTNGEMKGRHIPMRGIYDRKGGPGKIEENRKLLEGIIRYDPNYLHYHRGWFQEVLPYKHKQIDKIAILHLDADWYASTKICLDYLFDKVVSGGFVIIDDYGAYDGCKKAVDEFMMTTDKPLYLN